jgi:hypothetical protein
MTAATVIAAFVVTAVATQADTQLTKVKVLGNLVPGGTVQYKAVISSTSSGTIKLVGKVRSDGSLSDEFEVIEESISSGTTKLTSNQVSIPASFTGDARVIVTAYFNGVRVGKLTTNFTVVGPVAVTLYDVGFDTEVDLDGSLIPTGGMSGPLTYAWKQTDTEEEKELVIAGANQAAASVTTQPLENFINLELFELNPFGVVGIDTHQVEMSTYHLRLVVSDGSINRTGTWTVVSGSMSPGQKIVPVGVNTHLMTAEIVTNTQTVAADVAYNWTITSQPPESTATLQGANTRTPALRPDKEGNYTISDAVLGTNITLIAASYTGVDFCNICHGPNNEVGLADMVTPWSKTGHASFLKEGLDGELGSYYNESCIKCHTVGYNKTPTANNNGFDDVAASIGWKFPANKVPGTYDAQPAAIKALANIQCESCHGPGSRHPGPTSISLNVAVCAQCHQDGHYHTRVEQWERSPHFKGFREISEEEGENGTCARCHSPNGYVDVAKRIAGGQDVVTASKTNNYATGIGELICQGCHDPHNTFDNPDRHQLRIYDTVVVGDPAAAGNVVLTDMGVSATCMYCHNSRRLPYQLSSGKPRYAATRGANISGPHESTATEIFNGIEEGVVTYGQPLGDTFHTYGAKCVDCHMYPNPAIGAPGHNQVGDHTFNMTYNDGTNTVDNVAACAQCHTGGFGVDKFDVALYQRDYDGVNGVQGIQSETTGLLDAVRNLLNTTGVASVTNSEGIATGFVSPGAWSATNTVRDAQYKAAWNWMMVNRDHSKGVHNPRFTIRLLQNTYTDLSTNYYGNSELTFTNVFPNAVLYQ